jgi:hypothetical protein
MTTLIPYYVTDKGLLLRLDISSTKSVRVNDKTLDATFHPQWWTVAGEAEVFSFSTHAGTRPINERYVLINPSVAGVESIIRREDVERDEDGKWVGKHAGLDSLYRYESDKEDLGFVPAAFEATQLGNVTLDSLGNPSKFRYKLHKERHADSDEHLGYKDIFQRYSWLEQRIQVDDIAKAMTPDVAWHLYPCSISSGLAYRIIRSHVKDNIDPRFASVTSDYDFCFTIKKKVRVIPYTKQWEVKKQDGKSYRPPRFKTSHVEYVHHEVFEMTNDKDRYRGYTVVDGFAGASLHELAENIDRYLADLMAVINAPLAKCPHCEGRGVTDYFQLPTNEREQFLVEAA